MQPDDPDRAYVWDMLNACREIIDFAEGAEADTFAHDLMRRRAIERELEILGEAAKRLSVDFRERHQDVPWSQIIALRNILAHEYGEIRIDAIWLVVSRRVPELMAQIEPLIDTGEDAG